MSIIIITEWLQGLNELINMKHLEQCLGFQSIQHIMIALQGVVLLLVLLLLLLLAFSPYPL